MFHNLCRDQHEISAILSYFSFSYDTTSTATPLTLVLCVIFHFSDFSQLRMMRPRTWFKISSRSVVSQRARIFTLTIGAYHVFFCCFKFLIFLTFFIFIFHMFKFSSFHFSNVFHIVHVFFFFVFCIFLFFHLIIFFHFFIFCWHFNTISPLPD